MSILEAIAYLENYQKWRSEDDERTMDEAGITSKGVTQAMDVVLAFAKEEAGV